MKHILVTLALRYLDLALVLAWIAVGSIANAAEPPSAKESLVNGHFESLADEKFQGWRYFKDKPATPYQPGLTDRGHAVRIVSKGGLITQRVSEMGAVDFTWKLDFAVLPFSGTRSLHIGTYGDDPSSDPYHANNVDSIRVAESGELQFHHGGWVGTGLFVKPTADTGKKGSFDGETPIINHLEFAGTDYGTNSQGFTVTLNGKKFNGNGAVMSAAPKYFALLGFLSDADYLVDNITFFESASRPNLLKKALDLMDGAEEIVFAVRALYQDGHYYANFGGWSDDPKKFLHAPDGSRLCKMNLRTKKVTILLNDPKGNLRAPRVHYDGKKILFSYRKGGTRHYNLYEINVDGTNLKQLTFGEWDDFDASYLPDGGIIFVSSRFKRFIPCNHVQAAGLFRMDGDGSNMLCLSANNVRDDHPAVLPNGQIVYTRWEYVDSSIGSYRDLWVMNPDGTNQMILYGGTVTPPERVYSKCDALPIPGTDSKVVSIFSPPVGLRENAGDLMVVDLRNGPDDEPSAKQISPKREYNYNYSWPSSIMWFGQGRKGFRDPYPLSEDCFLVAENKTLSVMDGQGNLEPIYSAEKMVHDPRVIRPRQRERIVPSRIDLSQTTGQMVLINAYQGRGKEMEGVKPGSIKKLLILEDLPKPVSYFSLPGLISMDGTHTLRRVLGTVPVEPDGSASFELPALRGIYFVALDEKDIAVKRMQSYTMVMPGETQSCIGCHEVRTDTANPANRGAVMALKRAPSKIEPVAGVPEIFDYPRDIQPILDKHCVSCHSAEKPEGRVMLTGDRTEWFTQSYYTLFAYEQVSAMRGRYNTEFRSHPPYGFGTGASPLMKKIDNHHYDVKLTKQERDTVRLWIEASAYFASTHASYNYSECAVSEARLDNAEVKIGQPLAGIVYNRCLWCHDSAATMGKRVRNRGRMNISKHCWNLYNLSYPEKSMMLLAPLPKTEGGYGWCKDYYGQDAVFRNKKDPDYQAILRTIQAAKERQEKLGRYDMPGWKPNEHYVRWMKKFGVLPESFDLAKDPIGPHEVDKAYWQSLWHHPPVDGTALLDDGNKPNDQNQGAVR